MMSLTEVGSIAVLYRGTFLVPLSVPSFLFKNRTIGYYFRTFIVAIRYNLWNGVLI